MVRAGKRRKSNAGGITERKKKKKRRRKEASAIEEVGAQQVASSLNLVLNCTDSGNTITQLKRKRRFKGLQKRGRTCELPSDEASSEKEKQSLLAWVEMSMKPLCSGNIMHEWHGDIEHGHFAKGTAFNGYTRSLTVCVGNGTSGRICNGDAFAAGHVNGTLDPSAQVDHEGHVCGKISSNGHNSQSNHPTERCSSKGLNGQSLHEGHTCAGAMNCKKCFTSKHVNGVSQERSVHIGRSCRVLNGEVLDASCTFTPVPHSVNGYASRSGESALSCPAGAMHANHKPMLNGYVVRSGEDDSSCQVLDLEISDNSSLLKENDSVSLSNSANPHNNKRRREDDKVLQYVLKRSIVLHPSPLEPLSNKSKTTKTVVIAWGRNIPVTLTSEACAVQGWISSQSGNLFGLDVEWRPNRAKGEKNKVALLQLCSESECLIIQMLFLDKKPQALRQLLSDPSKGLAGVGVLADGKRLLHDYGLECQGGIELTTLAVERLKRDELRNVGLKVLVQEVLGLKMDKPKKVTLSNWAKSKLDPAQINYACMDAWASFVLSQKLLVDT